MSKKNKENKNNNNNTKITKTTIVTNVKTVIINSLLKETSNNFRCFRFLFKNTL